MVILPKILIQEALKKGIGRAAPLPYLSWYCFTEKTERIILLPYWQPWAAEIRHLNTNFIQYNLQNEVGVLITTKAHQYILLNRSSIENYMYVPIPWYSLPE